MLQTWTTLHVSAHITTTLLLKVFCTLPRNFSWKQTYFVNKVTKIQQKSYKNVPISFYVKIVVVDCHFTKTDPVIPQMTSDIVSDTCHRLAWPELMQIFCWLKPGVSANPTQPAQTFSIYCLSLFTTFCRSMWPEQSYLSEFCKSEQIILLRCCSYLMWWQIFPRHIKSCLLSALKVKCQVPQFSIIVPKSTHSSST